MGLKCESYCIPITLAFVDFATYDSLAINYDGQVVVEGAICIKVAPQEALLPSVGAPTTVAWPLSTKTWHGYSTMPV